MRTRRKAPKAAAPSTRAKAAVTPEGGLAPSIGGNRNGLYPVASESYQRGWRPQLDRDAAYLVTRYKQRAMLSDARFVYTGNGEVSGACRDKANFAVGSAWVPHYTGTNEAFKRAFNDVIVKRWLRNCEVRGKPYDWQQCAWLASVCLDRDGEVFILTTLSDFGAPRLQFLESHRIGSYAFNDRVPDLPDVQRQFVGKRCNNGIVYDDQMRPIAYNVLPPDDMTAYLRPNVWNLIDAASVIHVFDPQWFSQSRGIPTICNGILDWYDMAEIRDAEKIGVKANSRVTMLEYNDTGKPDYTSQAMLARASGDTATILANHTLIEAGQIRYFKAQTGNKLESFTSNRPSPAWSGFVEHVSRAAHRGMDWPYEMHDWSGVGGAGIRAVVGQVQRAIRNRQDVLWNPLMSALMYAVSVYIRNGQIPFASDWMDSIAFRLPPLFSVDVGRDSQNRRQDVAMGLRGADDVFGEEGEGDVESVFERRAQVWLKRDEVAARYGVPPEAIFNPASVINQAAATTAIVSEGDSEDEISGNTQPEGEDTDE